LGAAAIGSIFAFSSPSRNHFPQMPVFFYGGRLDSPVDRRTKFALARVTPVIWRSFGTWRMSQMGLMHVLIHWLTANATILAILVTVGVALLLVCCVECTKCPGREKDDLFKRREV
jgi:hypothetical protein